MVPNIQGPGMLWVTANITDSPTNTLTEEQYMRWYDDDHIAEIIQTSGMPNAFRYYDVDKASPRGTQQCPKPFLAFYPMADVAFLTGPEFRNIKVHSDLLPGTGLCYDVAETDVAYFSFIGQSGMLSGTQGGTEGKGSGQYLAVSAIEPVEGETDDEVNGFFDRQATNVSRVEYYQRSLRFRLLLARTNAQSRKLKGLPTADEPEPEPPTWLQVHEFSAEPTIDVRVVIKDASYEVLSRLKQNKTHAYRLAKAHGQKKFFEDGKSVGS